jgi:hypothetical protein
MGKEFAGRRMVETVADRTVVELELGSDSRRGSSRGSSVSSSPAFQ